jgi:hypothetical protein
MKFLEIHLLHNINICNTKAFQGFLNQIEAIVIGTYALVQI